MAADLLLRATLASSVASLLVLLLRRPARRVFGAGSAYILWLAIPACTLAILLPGPAAAMLPAYVTITLPGTGSAQPLSAPVAALGWRDLATAAWLAGATLFAAWFALTQRRFVRTLGPRTQAGRVRRSAGHGPAVIGLWRPAIVLPADFAQRYAREERRLILAHERVHATRGDTRANALCIAFQCVFWFNPLLHLAAAAMRFDQELACDEAVLRRHGQARTYANAMLKTQLALQAAPFACQWKSTHPLKERIMQLQRPIRSSRRTVGQVLVAALLAASSYVAWAEQAPATGNAAPDYDIVMHIATGQSVTMKAPAMAQGGDHKMHLITRGSEPIAVAVDEDGEKWVTNLIFSPAGDGKAIVKAEIKRGDKVVGKPTVLVALGADAGVGITDDDGRGYKLNFVVTERREK